MEAGAVRAVWGVGGQGAQGFVADRIAAGDGGLHREVGGAQVSVGDAHHSDTGHPAREVHPARARRVHRLSRFGGQVHPQMAGEPALFGRVEAAQHLDRRVHRPAPRGRGGQAGSMRDNGEEQERERQQEVPDAAVAHESSMR